MALWPSLSAAKRLRTSQEGRFERSPGIGGRRRTDEVSLHVECDIADSCYSVPQCLGRATEAISPASHVVWLGHVDPRARNGGRRKIFEHCCGGQWGWV